MEKQIRHIIMMKTTQYVNKKKKSVYCSKGTSVFFV